MKTPIAFASLLLVASAGAATTYFSANFDGTTLTETRTGAFMAQLTEGNLNDGTTVGTWTVNQAQDDANFTTANALGQKSIQGSGAGNNTINTNSDNKVLNLGSILNGTAGVANPFLTANLSTTLDLSNAITFSFDYASHAPDGNANERGSFFTGVDGSGNRLFQLYLVNTSNALAPNEGLRIGYINSSGATQLLGATTGDLNTTGVFQNSWDPSIMQTISVNVGASDYSISLGAIELASGIAFRDGDAAGLASIQLATNSLFTSGWIDNMLVTQIPEPSSALLFGLAGLGCMARRRR